MPSLDSGECLKPGNHASSSKKLRSLCALHMAWPMVASHGVELGEESTWMVLRLSSCVCTLWSAEQDVFVQDRVIITIGADKRPGLLGATSDMANATCYVLLMFIKASLHY